jgi:protein involved in plasmid replication-relaxation
MRPVPDAEALQITPSRRRILELVMRLRYVTPTLLGQVYSAGSPDGQGMKHVANELGRLYHNGYLARHFNPTRLPGEGGDSFVYRLSPNGARVVLSAEEWTAERSSIYRRAQAKSGYDHALMVSSLQAILEIGAQSWSLEDFVADHEDQSTQITVHVQGLGKRSIWPDAEAIVRLPRGDRLLYLFELDRTRRWYRRVDERFAAYAVHVSGQSLARLKSERNIAGAVVVLVGPFGAPDYFKLDEFVLRAHDVAARHTTAASRPQFLFWSTDRWFEDRIEGNSTGRLRDPRQILAEKKVLNLRGEWRQLVVTG